ncbi:kelch-like protein 3 [Paramacrobiotus metropolitanus]|uniref:kelch-like protein 3 n=1 Tax=Paramacrobiotus metropolitanus TaxID=2943436 RepID=UPI0024460264|nr:kelch-like protein 3 [Paramacrobiotus metropolitanus]
MGGGSGTTLNSSPRHAFGTQEVLVCVEDWKGYEQCSAVQVFSPSIPAVWRQTDLPLLVENAKAVVLDDGRLMMICCIHGVKTVQRDRRYTGLMGGPPVPLADLQPRRGDEAVALLNGRVYVAGGHGYAPSVPVAVLSSVDAYDPKSNAWSTLAPLPIGLIDLVLVPYDGLLYAFGGATMDRQASRAAFAYDPTADDWSRLPDMPTARSYCAACVAPDGLIYVVGGDAEDRKPCVRVEAYDPNSRQWLRKGDLVHPRRQPACACLDGQLYRYVLGGNAFYSGHGTDDRSVEVYDAAADRWLRHACRLSGDIVGCGAVTMKLKPA